MMFQVVYLRKKKFTFICFADERIAVSGWAATVPILSNNDYYGVSSTLIGLIRANQALSSFPISVAYRLIESIFDLMPVFAVTRENGEKMP